MSKSHKIVIIKEHTGETDIAERGMFVTASPLSGTLSAVCPNGEFSLNENEIIFIPDGEPYELHSVGEYVVIQCESAALSGNPALAELMPVLSEPLVMTDVPCGLINEMRELYKSASPTAEARLYIKMLEILVHIAERRSAPAHTEKNYAKLSLALNYIDRNYMYDISLDELASAAGYSKFHFSRLFRKFSGTSLSDYLNRRRIREAALLLEKTDMTITAVAMKSGFSGITTFNRVFKSIQGCTPSEFKKRKNNSNY